MKLFANEILKPFNLENGIFINNFIGHRKNFKDFGNGEKSQKDLIL